MKKLIPLSLLIFISIVSLRAQDTTYLDISNVKALVNSNGVLFSNLSTSNASYEVPKGSNKFSIYSSSLWMLDKKELNNKEIYSGAYESYGLDTIFNTGPVDIINQKSDNSPVYQRIWSVYQTEIDDHIQNWNDPNYTVPSSILDWPGNGNSNTAQNLAPYADLDNDNVYEPNDGEYPIIKGDQALFFILNDYRDPVTVVDTSSVFSDADTLVFQSANLEVHAMLYAYANQSAIISNTVFANIKIINRSNSSQGDLGDFRVSVWTDFDIGNPFDDYIGTDTLRSLVYGYNGDSFDESNPGITGYGNQLAAQGMKILNSELYSTHYYNNSNGNNGNPSHFVHIANYQRSKWKNGRVVYYGGDGYNSMCVNGNQPTNYMYTGNPDLSNTSSQWTEFNPCPNGVGQSANQPGDRRMLGTVDLPSQLLHGDTLVMDYAYVFALADNNATPVKKAVSELFLAADTVQNFYDSMVIAGISENYKQISTFNLYPNPSNHFVNIEIEAKEFDLAIYDLNGRLIKELQNKEQFSVEELKNGIYFVQIIAEGSVMSRKLIVQR